MKWQLKSVWTSILVVFLFAIDRVLKYLFHQLSFGREFFIFSDWVKLKLAYNSGIAFGLPVNWYVIIVFYLIALVALVWYLLAWILEKDWYRIFLTGLVIAGAFSNLLDRIQIGRVIDYIDVKYYSVFNLADIMIVTGILLLLVKNYRLEDKKLIK